MTDQAVRPNILFILADDLGWGDVSYHGSPIRTPNIDRLVSYGVELDQHYVCPVCTPTRAALMSGRYPSRFGRHATSPSNEPVFQDDYVTLPRALKRAGYETGLFGKWHLGSDPKFAPNRFGFDTSYGSLAGGVDPWNHRYKVGPYSYTWHRNGERADELGHVTDLIVDEAVNWIQSRTGPWFCYVPFTAVHTPIDAPAAWIDQYAGTRYDQDVAMDESFKRYAAYTTHMDHGVGLLVDAVKSVSQFDNTIIVVTSDNGAPLGDLTNDTDKYPGWHWDSPRRGANLPLRGGKGQFYEGGIRTPAVITWPGTLQRSKCCHPLFMSDWMPTFTKLVGAEHHDDGWDGRDIWGTISGADGPEAPTERQIYWNRKDNQFALRLGDWKVISGAQLSPETAELFHLGQDPYEARDLSREYPGVVQDLLARIKEERTKDGAFKRPDVSE